jgi:hypothetical protein
MGTLMRLLDCNTRPRVLTLVIRLLRRGHCIREVAFVLVLTGRRKAQRQPACNLLGQMGQLRAACHERGRNAVIEDV